jgi:hypothetical protein
VNTTIAIIIAAWLLLAGGVVCFLFGATHTPTPKPVPTKDQMDWMRAAAKVAARRHA